MNKVLFLFNERNKLRLYQKEANSLISNNN